jgi:GNAT superfamily N-acetyltransferase
VRNRRHIFAHVEIRRATEADLDAEYEVFRTAIGELYRRHAFEPPSPPRDAFAAHQGHLLRSDGERSLVATDGGRVVAFVAAIVRGQAWFLASLFVLPEYQSAGLGTRLLDSVWGDRHGRRLTLTDAIQPVSNGLYARRGLIPATPMLHLGGIVSPAAAHGLEPSVQDPAVLRTLDHAAYGFDREPDHAHWGRFARVTVWLRTGEPIAYSYVWPHGRIGPLAGLDGTAAAAALRAELDRLRGREAEVVAPGSSAELIEAALEAGLRFTRPPGLLLLSRGVPLPRGLAISGYSLL